jgi:SAM-dependent methyltransferase
MPDLQTDSRDIRTSLSRELEEVVRVKLGSFTGIGWSPRLRQDYQYFTPDEWYEAVLLRLVDERTDWLDVGCGRELCPGNQDLGKFLASRCRLVVGVDPDENINLNTVLHHRVRCRLEEYNEARQFDLISLRMVAEHISDPVSAVRALSRLTRVGGRVLVYTVSRWSVVSLAAALTPMAVHHYVKRLLWGSLEEDNFPTLYRMNTRSKLQQLFTDSQFVEEEFLYLDDCRTFGKWQTATKLELKLERYLRAKGIRYPEVCLLGIYQKK